jgi:Glycosyltransferase family 10 (fucosyltransferase) C-term/Fucosyltransferase, N-terminal
VSATEPILVVFVNSMWGVYPDADASACAVPCAFSVDIADYRQADVAVFHLPTTPPLDAIEKPPGQMWVAFSMESDITVPLLRDERTMTRFDFEVSYRRTADVWCPYFDRDVLADLRAAPAPKTEPYPVARFQSNPYDRSGRNVWARELTRRIKVASYGTVLPTMPSAGMIATREARLAVAARHKFTLAFENSIAVDYVTDKLFDVWVAGSVPVYLGAPNVADFAPARHSYIDVADFDGPDELARYLNHLDTHDDEYEAYLEWKRSGPDERFLDLVASAHEDKFCRLVELAHARRSRRGRRRGA